MSDKIIKLQKAVDPTLYGKAIPGDIILYVSSAGKLRTINENGVDEAVSSAGSTPAGGATGQALVKLSNADGDYDWRDLSDIAGVGSFVNTSIVGTDGSGNLQSISGWSISPEGGANIALTNEPNASGFITLHSHSVSVDPQGNSPTDGMNFFNLSVNHDPNSSGFTYGTSGSAYNMVNIGLTHNGSGNLGQIIMVNSNPDIGNGTDPIELNGYQGMYAGLQIDANVTLKNGIQGFIYQPNLNAASVLHSSAYFAAFGDYAQIPVGINNYQSVNLGPTISSVNNNSSYMGMNINPGITTLTGNASVTGVSISGSIGSAGTGGFNGVNINTSFTTVPASGFYNGTFVGGQIATLSGNYSGVSVAPDINAGAGNATGINISMTEADNSGSNIALNITGAGGNSAIAIQSSNGHHNMNCDITVASTLGQQYGNILGGALTLGANATVTGTDVLANNLAYTIDLGSGTTSYTSSFFGIANVGFVGQITGSASGTVDNLQFLLVGYNAAHSAGTITNLYNINCLAITSGAGGAITNSIGYHYDVPFGPVATDHWGVMVDYADAYNHFEGSVSIGTATKKPANSSVGLELDSTTKAVLFSRMTTTERDALTAVNGMVIYNSTTDKLQVRAAGVWIDLH